MHKLLKKLSNVNVYNKIISSTPLVSRNTITNMNLNSVELPKQPVPNLSTTAEKYLRSLQPILNNVEFERTEKIVKEFVSENGMGPKLQKELVKRYEITDNWMSQWWLNSAYLGYRAPVIVNSSPGTVSVLPSINEKSYIFYAAVLVDAILQYHNMVKSGKLKQEMIRDVPLDMQPYAMILGTHRRPDRCYDHLLHTDNSNHIIIIHNAHMFKMEIPCAKNNLKDHIYASLRNIVKCSQEPCSPIGILTGTDRDSWALVHEELLCLGNQNLLQDIEESLFILCLDKQLPKSESSTKNIASVKALQCMTGISSSTNAGNRWHDKTVQYIISPDGLVGMEYEHSPCEGVPVAVLHDFVMKILMSATYHTIPASHPFALTKHLEFKTDSSIAKSIASASEVVDKLSADTDMECFTFEDFGTNKIKEAKLSPDSFIQIAMQATYYTLHNKPPVHYESAGLRRFKNARTECIRSTCSESVEFAKNIASQCQDMAKLRELMIRAINAHKQLASEAAMGQGVDRHLFGLKMIAKEQGIESPEIFEDVGYKRSTHFSLTSSQVPYKTDSFMCYGPVVPDGYGCCYNPRPEDIFFSCSSFNSCNQTSSKNFAKTLQKMLCKMLELAQSK